MTRRIRYPDIDAAVNQGMSDFEPARLRGFPCGFMDETALITESNMNDALFCSVPFDGSLPRDAMASLVAELRNSLDRDHRNQSIAITENGRWRSPKTVHRDRRPDQSEQIPGSRRS